MNTFNLAKFDSGIVYFVKEQIEISAENSIEKISAIVNVEELKEHAQYNIVVIETETSHKAEFPIHGVYLTPNNILTIAVSHLKRDPSLISDLERIS